MPRDNLHKETEKIQIERFAKLLGFDNDNLQFPDNDPPDALISTTGGVIALEHTRVISEKEREEETIKAKCVLKTRKEWFKAELPAISADILFNDQGPLTYSQIDLATKIIYDKIFQFVGPLHHIKSRTSDASITVYISSCAPGMRAHWRCINNHVGWVKKIANSKLQTTITRKSKAIKRYSHPYDKAWLLVFLESEYASSMYSLDTQFLHESGFDRIYLSNGFEYKELMRR